MLFAWTSGNIEHIGRHGVTPAEAEYVVRGARSPYPEAARDGKFRVWGRTASGRLLQVIFVHPPDHDIDPESLSPGARIDWLEDNDVVFRVIHARELTDEEKKQHRRRSRR